MDARDDASCSPLHVAAHRGHVAMVGFLLKRAGDDSVCWQDSHGQTALHKAQISAGLHTTEALLAAGQHHNIVNVQDHSGNTALHAALTSFTQGTVKVTCSITVETRLYM